MPRGIPKLKGIPKDEPVTVEQEMYSLYAHGMSIQDVADRFDWETQDVMDAIGVIEAKR